MEKAHAWYLRKVVDDVSELSKQVSLRQRRNETLAKFDVE